ncbi:MAG: DUF1565 domain-containing protein [Leptolyngbyaceae cyanobacterium SL_1_1]|nr:DUF1565 domain-containing protein [Leptolyngbyaceae cyanobacterium SL_1_1]
MQISSPVVRSCLSLGCLLAVALPPVSALAQTVSPEIELAQIQPASTAATDLQIAPRWRINYNSSNGGYDDGFTGFEGFIPLLQTPGSSVVYLVPRLSLDDDINLGGSLLAGYRFLSGSTLLGGYAGFDFRGTGRSDFTQFSAGLEAFGDVWDVHLNAYLPIGDDRNRIASSGDTSGTPGNFRFQGNRLVFDTGSFSQFEAALGGVDLEAGLRLSEFAGGWGSLWGYSGLYYYSGNGSDDSLGVRARLDYRLQENLRFGLGIQHDDLFGTNVFFSVNATVGGPTRLPDADAVGQEARVWARAAESLTRNPAIVVENQTERSLQVGQVALDPATGDAYLFVHVTPGTVGGSGAVESPLGAIAPALATVSPGNVIYVRPGDSAANPLSAFTIPGGVQVLSSGVEQLLPIQFASGLATVMLPDFGDRAVLPRIENGVTLVGGNNTLAGFDLFNGVNGVTVESSSGAIVRDNLVTNASGSGILAQNSSNNVLIQNNTLFDNFLGVTVLSGSDGAVVQGNRIFDIGDTAVSFANSGNGLIQQNTLFNARFGIEASGTTNLAVQIIRFHRLTRLQLCFKAARRERRSGKI